MALIDDQKRGGVVPVVEPIVPFGVVVLEFGVMVEEFGVMVLGDVVERLRERDREERVVVVDGLLIVELVDVLGVVWSIVPIVPVVEPIVPVVDPIVPVVLPMVPVVEPIDPVPVEPPVVCAEAMAGSASAAAAIEIMIRMSVSPVNYRH